MPGHLLPTGAGRAVMDRRTDPLHTYTLELTGKERPRILFLGTATGDDPAYIVSFYQTYTALPCEPAHLRLFTITERDVPGFITQHDVIHVGGGNTANMLDVWRRQGVDRALRDAWEAGAVMTGGSAGGLCWFEGGTTDSFGPELKVLADGLGFVPGSFCPHYDAEDDRKPLFHQAILDGTLPTGYAVWNRVALHFDGTELVGGVSSEEGGRALRVFNDGGTIVEEEIPIEFLGTGDEGRVAAT
jgi:dipeptidase E